MAGLIRWKNLQNILTTENEINLLAGLQATAENINQIIGFSGTGEDLNNAVQGASDFFSHQSTHLASAHPIQANSLDGNIIGDETLPITKILNYQNILTQDDISEFDQEVTIIQQGLDTANSEIANLYSIVFGIGDDGLPQVINNLIQHIEQVSDAHDASAISLGNYYPLTADTLAGGSQIQISLDNIKWFKINDIVSITDDISTYYERTVSNINYNTGQILLDAPISDVLTLSHNAIIFNRTQGNAQTGIERSLRNTTDTFTGRLTINQDTTDNAIEINKTNSGYLARFNNFTSKTDDSFEIELGRNDGTSHFILDNSDKRVAFSVTDDGTTHLNNILFEDRDVGFIGQMDHQPLTAGRDWILPNRSGYIGLGDLTFQELLKVTQIEGTKELAIAPAFGLNYDGELVHVWTTMEEPSKFPGGTINIQSQYSLDNKLLALEDNWQVVNVFITDQDSIGFMYGPEEAVREDAIANFVNIVPSAYMKLAQIIVRGDGLGGIDQSTIQILSDQRPIFTMGVSAAFYDESVEYPSGVTAGTVLTIPKNYRAGGIRQTYKPGKAQLEVYLDGIYQKVDLDYQEVQGEPEGQIRFLKDLQPDSTLRYRITYTSAAAGGGIQAATLQSAYQSGPSVAVTQIYGPIEISSLDTDIPFIVKKSMQIQGMLYGGTGLELVPQLSEPGNTDISKLYLDQNQDLILKRYNPAGSTYYNITAEIVNAQQAISKSFINATGAAITLGQAVALHPSLTNHIVLCNASADIPEAKCIGIASETIPNGATGKVTFKGIIDGISGFGQGQTIVVDPSVPGAIIAEGARVDTATSQDVFVGYINGSQLVVDIHRYKKSFKNIKAKVAGEAFEANIPKLVRLAKGTTETYGAVYKASKTLANVNRNFWVYGLVCPKVTINPGETIEVYMESEKLDIPVVAGVQFVNNHIGHPFYLGDDGDFDYFDNITFNSADAIVKVGMIENARAITVKGIQMMGTQP